MKEYLMFDREILNHQKKISTGIFLSYARQMCNKEM